MNLTPHLLSLLACPRCKGPLEHSPAENELLCHACALAYPVRDDIPVMLIDEARPLNQNPERQG